MATSSNQIDYSTVAGQFEEREYGNRFEYRAASDNPAAMPHEIFVGPNDDYRYGRVLKTVAYVVVDEDEYGNPVIEKWSVKPIWAREERGAEFTDLPDWISC